MTFSYELSGTPLEKLLELYREGNPDAFTEFYKRTNKFIYNFLRTYLSAADEADEVFQETYFRIHKYVSTYDTSKKAIVWLISISRNCLRDYLRVKMKNKEMMVNELSENLASSDRADALIKLESLISEICAELTREETKILLDRLLQEDSYEELAQKYGVTTETARQRVSRILRKLKDTLKN